MSEIDPLLLKEIRTTYKIACASSSESETAIGQFIEKHSLPRKSSDEVRWRACIVFAAFVTQYNGNVSLYDEQLEWLAGKRAGSFPSPPKGQTPQI